MSQTIEILGVHPHEAAPRPCHLVEALVHGSDCDFAMFDFIQERPGVPQVDWEIPYCAKILDETGSRVLADAAGTCDEIDLWLGDVRFAFFFHHLDPSRKMQTPFGEVDLPAPTPMPSRLSCMDYEEE